MKKIRISVTGENVEIVERLCAVTGLNPHSLIALLLRKYGRDMETWMENSAVAPPVAPASPSAPLLSPSPASMPQPARSSVSASVPSPDLPLELPTDPGNHLGEIEL